jgi:hypothetical protein
MDALVESIVQRLEDWKGFLEKPGDDYNSDIKRELDKYQSDYDEFETAISTSLDDWGKSEKTRITLAFTTQRTAAQAELQNDGLLNALTWNPISTGITRDMNVALTDLADKIIERQLALDTELYTSEAKAHADLIAGLAGSRQHDLQAISTLVPHIMQEVNTLAQEYSTVFNAAYNRTLQLTGMNVDSILKIYDSEIRFAELEAKYGLANHELTVKVLGMKTQMASAKAQAFTSENSSIRNFESSVVGSENSLTASVYNAKNSLAISNAVNRANVEMSNAKDGTNVSIAQAQMEANATTQETSLLAQDVMSKNSIQGQLTAAVADAYKYQMSLTPKFSDLAGLMGSAASIEGVE